MALERSEHPDHEIPFAAHPCRSLVEFGGCGTFCDWLRATSMREHSHRRLQVVATSRETEGDFRYRLSSGRWQRLQLRGENVIVIPADLPHGGRWFKPAGLTSVLVDEPQVLAATSGLTVNTLACSPCGHCPAVTPFMRDLCNQLWRECQKPGPQNAAIIGPLGAALASFVLRAHFSPQPDGNSQHWLLNRVKLVAVQTYVQKNLAGDLSLTVLARVAGLSRSYFGHVFRMATGLPPTIYVFGVRVQKAIELLGSGDYKAKEVPYLVGFSSQQAMSTAFQQVLGASPGAFLPGGERNHQQIEKLRKRPRWVFC